MMWQQVSKMVNTYLGIRNYDLVLLDWMLPDGNGIDIIPKLKDKASRTSVIVVSARDDRESEIRGSKGWQQMTL